MKRLSFQYHMEIAFDSPVHDHRFSLRCVPHSDDRQEIARCRWLIVPQPRLGEDEDSFGNHLIYGVVSEEHTLFCVDVQGLAVTGLRPFRENAAPARLGSFRCQTKMTMPGPALSGYARKLEEEWNGSAGGPLDSLEYAAFLMHAIHRDYVYHGGVTQIGTTAEQAWQMGCGVCQDYAQIMLSLLRMKHIPCMYVTGMLMGEGQSHAWVEVCRDNRWYGFDPTNDMLAEDCHIRISGGRDFSDCRINQGIFRGMARQAQTICVQVKEEDGVQADGSGMTDAGLSSR